MSNLNLQTLPDLGVPGATITLPMPGTVPEGLVDRARAAANGNGPAPAVAWKPAELTGAVVELSFLDQQKLIIAPEALVDVPPSICVVQVIDSTRSESDAFVLVSGVVVIDVEKMGAAASVLEKIWPKVSVDRFGKIVRFVVASNGLHIETELTVGGAAVFRRFRLGAGARVQPEKGKSALLVWQQVTWRDASLASLVGKTHKNPVDRLNEVMTESDRRLDDPDQRLKRAPGVVPVARIDRFDLRSEGEGSVFVDVRNEVNAQGTEQPTQARERISPAWALAVGGADWVPRSLTVVGDDLSGAVLTYSDGEASFEEPATFSKENLTSLSWNWKSAELSTRKHVYPLLSNLATSPPLLSTGEFPGAGVNSPYLWQMTRLVVGKAQSQSQRVEPGVWIRYRLDPLAERETALTRQPDIDAGLSRPLRIEGLSRTDKDSGSPFESWILDLGLLPDGGPAIDTGRSRIRLELQPVTGAAGSESRAVALTLIAARIRATTPPMLALRDALVDPAAMPNRANKLQNLYSNARIVLANDREDPSDVGPPTHALEANHDAPTGALRLQALANARDVVVTYVPGPLAGLDLVSRARGNLTPLQTANPNDRPIPDWVREYEAGRVAVHLLKNIDLRVPSEQNANNPGEVRVVTLGDEPGEEVFMPGSESIATLFPWALSVTKQGDFKAHELTPFHRNLSLEAQEWAL
ncbi:MAG: hypothetical protein NT069_32175, partial [Planctomycetota bacterium]|nr:hypothetical protein [Planctomycetota bacterium]